MLVRAFRQERSVVLVSVGIAALVPAATANAAPAAPSSSAPAAPAAPRIASIAAACHGAGATRGTRVRRIAVACLVNHARAASGLRGFRGSAALARAAARHAADMARAHYFAHQRAGGPSLVQRARRAGFHGRSIGEAIAYGCGRLGSPAAIVSAWLNSPPHRAILLSGTLAKAGIGVAARPPVACGGRGATFVLDAGR